MPLARVTQTGTYINPQMVVAIMPHTNGSAVYLAGKHDPVFLTIQPDDLAEKLNLTSRHYNVTETDPYGFHIQGMF